MATREEPKGSYADLQSVGRAIAVLEQLADGPMRPADLGRALGIKWTTAYRTLTYLTRLGYLERDEETGRYGLGVRAYAIGSSYVVRLPLHGLARPVLEAASARTGGTAQLVTRDHRRSVVLSVFEARRDYVPETTIGCNFPLHCGSKGHVLLAHADPDFIDDYLSRPLEALTAHSITDPEVLRARLAEVRARGYAVTSRDVRLFSASVAAPIHDRHGAVVASVTLVVPPEDLARRGPQLVDVVVRTGRLLSRRLRQHPSAA
jgi:DNA-binding IclR family transcriptional regulator